MSYTINFSNSHKPNIIVNNQTVKTSSLSISLYGEGYLNWGELFQENVVKILENFDSDTSPNNPTNGQLFHKRSYSNSDHQLQIFHNGTWHNVLLLNTTQPVAPFAGQLWFDGANGYKFRDSNNTSWLKITDGMLPLAGGTLTGNVTLSVTPTNNNHITTNGYVDQNFLNLTGGTLTGNVALSATPTNNNHITTKGYVDTQISNNNVTLSNYLLKSGDTMTGSLTLSSDPTNAYHAATKNYVDQTITSAAALGFTPVNKAGDTMTGLLTLSGDPTNAYHAATKNYVDNLNYLNTITGGVVSGNVNFSGLTNFSNNIVLTATPTLTTHVVSKGYVDSSYLALSGGTLTGNVSLGVAPSLSSHLVPKSYVDGAFLTKTGGTLTGDLTIASTYEVFVTTAPSTVNSLTNKHHGDTQIAAGLTGTVLNASESARGIIQIATTTEVKAGANDTKAVTPAKLAQLASTTSSKGIIQTATTAQVMAGTDTSCAVVPADLQHKLNNITSISNTLYTITAGSGNWTVPANITRIKVTAVGSGGGASAGTSTTFGSITGGGGGAYTYAIVSNGGSASGGDVNIAGGSGDAQNNDFDSSVTLYADGGYSAVGGAAGRGVRFSISSEGSITGGGGGGTAIKIFTVTPGDAIAYSVGGNGIIIIEY